MSSRSLVAADIWFSLAACAGAVDSAVRESSRSFTGWVVEPVFESPQSAADFAQRASGVVGVGIVVRRWVPVAWSPSVPVFLTRTRRRSTAGAATVKGMVSDSS